jgi:hypothetical protein
MNRSAVASDETLRQTHREAVAIPVLRDAADLHLQMPRRRIRVEHAEMLAQLALGFVGRTER